MKLFKTSDRNIVGSCQEKFGFVLPAKYSIRQKKEEIKGNIYERL